MEILDNATTQNNEFDSLLESVNKKEQELKNMDKIKKKIAELNRLSAQVEKKKKEILELKDKITL